MNKRQIKAINIAIGILEQYADELYCSHTNVCTGRWAPGTREEKRLHKSIRETTKMLRTISE